MYVPMLEVESALVWKYHVLLMRFDVYFGLWEIFVLFFSAAK